MRADIHPASGLSLLRLGRRLTLFVVLRVGRSLRILILGTLLILRRRATLLILRRRPTLLILRRRTTLLILRRRTTLLILRRRTTLLILRRRTTLFVLLRSLLILLRILLIRHSLLVLIGSALLILALRLAFVAFCAMSPHLLAELVLLIRRQRSHELLAQLAHRSVPARAPLGMRLRVVMNDGLHALLLIVREIQLVQALCPMLLEPPFAGHALTVRTRGRRLRLLSERADRHRDGCGENARGQEVDLHGLDLSPFD